MHKGKHNMFIGHSIFKSLVAAAVVATVAAPSSLLGIVAPAVFNEKAEKSKLKAVATVVSIKSIEEKDGIEKRFVTFKLEKRISEEPVPEEFIGSCSTVVKGKPKIGEMLYFSPLKGQRYYVTISEKDNEISSLTPMSPRLMNALVKTPEKVKFNIGTAVVDDGADQHLEKGGDALLKTDFRQAIVEANKAIQICNTYDRAYHLRGRIFMETGKYDSAEEDFSKALQLNPDFSDALYQRGICRNNQRHFDDAIEDFNKVVAADPADLQALYCRASAYKYSGALDKALADYRKIEAADKNNHIVSRQIAFINYETNDLQAAERQFARTLQIEPADMYAAIFLHIVQTKLKKPSDINAVAAKIKDSDEWPAPVVKMFAGTLSPEKCVELASSGKPADQWKLSGALFYAAEKSLFDGDKDKAAAYLKRCMETKDSMGLEYVYAKKELASLKGK
jgi:lipoprotein NlpI